MELIFLGTGAGVPSRERNVTAIALNLQAERGSTWLFDCGEATQHQILRSPVKAGKLEKIFITHLHGDHIFGLPGLLSSRSMNGARDPLTLYGPPGIKAFIESALTLSASYLTYPLDVVEIDAGVVCADAQFTVTALPLTHGVPSFGYRIEECDKPGALDAARLAADGIPAGPWMQYLKRGERAALPDGRQVDGAAYLGPGPKGRVLVIFGDTAPTPNAVRLARDADVMVHEATLEAAMTEQANRHGHSTTHQAAAVARDAGAKKLIITHFSARYDRQESEKLKEECRAIFPNTEAASDFATFTVP